MYVTLYRDVRLTDKFFDKKTIDKFKKDILDNNYFSNVPDISNMNTMQELFELFGLYISDIQDDEYHWCTFKASVFDIKRVEEVLKRYRCCFHEYSKIAFIKPGTYEYLVFPNNGKSFIEESLDYIIEDDFDERFRIIKRNGKFFRNKIRTSEFEDVTASDIYKEFMAAWSEDSNFYSLSKENGLWRCRYHVPIYDGISIELYGYGHTKYEALEHCDKEYNKLKEQAIEEGYKEDDD